MNNPNGDGGVLNINPSIKTTAAAKAPSTISMLPEAKCVRCGKAWDRYVGKKKCNTCGVPVLVCDTCLSEMGSLPSDQQQKEIKQLRCALCVEENCTVAAQDVEFTNNGMSGKAVVSSEEADRHVPKAAPSVLKWGGGHAKEKKNKRRLHRQQQRREVNAMKKTSIPE